MVVMMTMMMMMMAMVVVVMVMVMVVMMITMNIRCRDDFCSSDYESITKYLHSVLTSIVLTYKSYNLTIVFVHS